MSFWKKHARNSERSMVQTPNFALSWTMQATIQNWWVYVFNDLWKQFLYLDISFLLRVKQWRDVLIFFLAKNFFEMSDQWSHKVSGFGHLVSAHSKALTGCPNLFLAKNFFEMSDQYSHKHSWFGHLFPAQSKAVTGRPNFFFTKIFWESQIGIHTKFQDLDISFLLRVKQ